MTTIGALWLAGLRSGLQYRTDTFIVVVMAIVFQGTGFAFIWVVLTRFPTVGGWSLGEIAFLYGLRLTVHAVAGAIAGAMFDLESVVRSGDFDRYLLRPISPLAGFLTRRIEISIFGDLAGGIAIFAVAAASSGIAWSPPAIAFLVLATAGGALVEVACRILVGAATFRLMSSTWLLYLLDSVMSTYGNFPLVIFGRTLGWVFTFVLPIAFLAYLPAAVLLDRTQELAVSSIVAVAAPLVGIAWIAMATHVFHHELRAYQSAGH